MPDYAGSTVTVAMQFGVPPLGPADAQTVTITITDAASVVIAGPAALAFNSTTGQWEYQWATPSDGGGRTFLLQGVFTGLDGSVTPAWGTRELAVPLDAEPSTSPVGVIPASKHFLSTWCDEDDIPPRRLLDSNGNPIEDVPVGFCISAATELLFALGGGARGRSGRSVVRPTTLTSAYGTQSFLYPYSSMSGYGTAWGFAAGWAWTALGMGWWQNGQALSEVLLQGPVTRINSVMVDGVVLDPSEYTLYDRRRLVRNISDNGPLSSGGSWPWQQQLQLPITSPGTWQIDYEWGSGPRSPFLARMACAEVAIQLLLGFSGQDSCKLPARVQQVATQGVSVAVGDAMEFLKESLTGLPIVDQWLRAVNPAGRRRRSTFVSPNTVVRKTT